MSPYYEYEDDELASFLMSNHNDNNNTPNNTRPPLQHRQSSSSSGRPPRLSHRSRAGCWTCRARKVKCDEAHPRCGPCTRLNRECDWGQRWSFSDATQTTQYKHANVKTSGNAVWDPTVRRLRSAPSSYREGGEDLIDPEFPSLAEEERERKAGMRRPGTYGLVLTPESFQRSDIPEYAVDIDEKQPRGGRSSSGRSDTSRPAIRRAQTQLAPNVVILDRFEDGVSLTRSSSSWSLPDELKRRDSFPAIGGLTIKTEHITTANSCLTSAPPTPTFQSEDFLIRHFRQYVVPRLVQPQLSGTSLQGSMYDCLEFEALRFRPLHHAMCAISALNLAYNHQSTMEEAMQHYHKALGASEDVPGSPGDLLSDGVFFRHFLLLIYEICIASNSGSLDDHGSNSSMWAEHLAHLRRLTLQRHGICTMGNMYAYTIWKICELDMYACLFGGGNCDYLQTIYGSGNALLPPVEMQIPCLAHVPSVSTVTSPFLPGEVHVFPDILKLHQAITGIAAKVAMTAQACRANAARNSPNGFVTGEQLAQWQQTALRLQNEIQMAWTAAYPRQHVGPDHVAPMLQMMSERVRFVFENAVLLYHAITLYARTSMFPGQSRLHCMSDASIRNDTEARTSAILNAARGQMHINTNRQLVFPIFIAGVVTRNPQNKSTAMSFLQQLEHTGIGRNTMRTKQLLVAVYEEQTRHLHAGENMEDADWLRIARLQRLDVVNCGL